jgi:hypothetical protein
MSMIGYLRRLDSDDVIKLEKNPSHVKTLLRGPYDMMAAIKDQLRGKASAKRAAMEAARASAQQISDALRNSNRPPGPITPAEMRAVMRPLVEAGAFGDDHDVLNLQKSWHTLHYLLTGSAEPVDTPLGKAILGGSDVGPDLGYGPARLLRAEEVQVVATALAALSPEDVARRFDLPTMQGVGIYACDSEDELPLALEFFEQMQDFYTESAARGCAMLSYLK